VTIFEVVLFSTVKLTLNRRHLGVAVVDVASELMGRQRIIARARVSLIVDVLDVGNTLGLRDPKPPS